MAKESLSWQRAAQDAVVGKNDAANHPAHHRVRAAMNLPVLLTDIGRRWRKAARVRVLAYALIGSVLCGVTGFLEPVDDAIRTVRYLARSVSADKSIVVVGIDQESLDKLKGEWPWPRPYYAEIIRRLKESGANKIVFDKSLSNNNSESNDNKFIKVVKKYKGNVYLGVGFGQMNESNINGMISSSSVIRSYVREASFKVRYNPFGQVDQVYTYVINEGNKIPSISSVVSGQYDLPMRLFRPDFSIKHEGFPYISASDLILGVPIKIDVRGKNVLLGDAARSLGDMKFMPGHQQIPGMYVHAMAAQTLKSGIPIDLGWFIPWCLAFIVGYSNLYSKKIRWFFAINSTVLAFFAFIPIVLDAAHISVELAPGLLLLGIVLVQSARLRLGWQKSRINEMSGLSNVVALRELPSVPGTAVIAARVDNYSAIVASFPSEVEVSIVEQIVARLQLRNDELNIYQADDGVFYWVSPISQVAELGDHLEGLKAVFGAAMQIGDRRVDVTVSFGADLDASRSVGSRAGSALLCATEALRAGTRWKLYDPTRSVDAAWQLSLASEIDHAMDTEEFWLAYQPKFDLKTGGITGAEVLLRWNHPERGNITPAEFIPAAERSDRIGRLTEYVLQRALSAAQVLAADGSYKLAINVSVPVLGDANFADRLVEKCRNYGVRSSRIIIEITESVLMSADDAQVKATLDELRSNGFGLSIDDFGTGFSSLEYVRSIPAHEVKIDQSFVKRVLTSAADRVVVESVLRMAHELGRVVVAEGVEDAETLDLLRKLGCDEVQGYHVGRPMDFMSFRTRLQKDRDDGHNKGRAAA